MKVNRTISRIARTLHGIRIAALILTASASGLYGLGQKIVSEDIFDPAVYEHHAIRCDIAMAICIVAAIMAYGELRKTQPR